MSIVDIRDYQAQVGGNPDTNASALQNALDSGNKVYVPSEDGIFDISQHIQMRPGMHIFGDGRTKSYLRFVGTGPMFTDLGDPAHNATFEDLGIAQTNAPQSTCAIQLQNTYGVTLNRVSIQGGRGGFTQALLTLLGRGSNNGAYFRAIACEFQGAVGHGVLIDDEAGHGGATFLGCRMQGSVGIGLNQVFSPSGNAGKSLITVIGGGIEGNGGGQVKADCLRGSLFQGVHIENSDQQSTEPVTFGERVSGTTRGQFLGLSMLGGSVFGKMSKSCIGFPSTAGSTGLVIAGVDMNILPGTQGVLGAIRMRAQHKIAFFGNSLTGALDPTIANAVGETYDIGGFRSSNLSGIVQDANGLDLGGGMRSGIVRISASSTPTAPLSARASLFLISSPNATTQYLPHHAEGARYEFRNIGLAPCTIVPLTGGIDATSSYTIAPGGHLRLVDDGTDYWTL